MAPHAPPPARASAAGQKNTERGHPGQPASSGTVMLAALPVLVGIQFLIAFLHYDVSHLPTGPLSLDLEDER